MQKLFECSVCDEEITNQLDIRNILTLLKCDARSINNGIIILCSEKCINNFKQKNRNYEALKNNEKYSFIYEHDYEYRCNRPCMTLSKILNLDEYGRQRCEWCK